MSTADDLATMARVGGNIIYCTGQLIGQRIGMAIDAHNWINEDTEDDEEEPEPPIDEDVFENTRRIIERGASRSRSSSRENEEQASSSNDAIRLLRRGTSRSRSETPPKRNPKKQ